MSFALTVHCWELCLCAFSALPDFKITGSMSSERGRGALELQQKRNLLYKWLKYKKTLDLLLL